MSAFIAWLKFQDEATYHPVQYGGKIPDMEPNSEVYILDFSYPTKILHDIEDSRKLVVLDHHATARTELEYMMTERKNPQTEIWFDLAHSGATLSWQYFFPNIRQPDAVNYIRDRDLWKWKMLHSREWSAGLRSHPMNFEWWSKLLRITSENKIDRKATYTMGGTRLANKALIDEGYVALRVAKQNVENQTRHPRMALFCANRPKIEYVIIPPGQAGYLWHEVPTANVTTESSMCGEKLLEMCPKSPFSATYFDTQDDRIWSLRSRPDFDCSVIAKLFGGGGHKQASGFRQPIER
jgi:hypothetical protein